MSFTTSINIERDFGKTPHYIVTANARQTIGKIINHFASGIHSFCLIGSYGTGKSSFILALENCLCGKTVGKNVLLSQCGQFNSFEQFSFINIVDDYTSLANLLASHLNAESKNVISVLDNHYNRLQLANQFLVIVIDEFGKVLEHAAKNNPEKEMYFLQKFCEYVNDTSKNILFLTTLHQGFGAYAKGLKAEQKQEWTKVKGRIQDIVFAEPIEQLLNLTATHISSADKKPTLNTDKIYNLAVASKFAASTLDANVARALYPMDIVSAYVFTQANQRYGQNERTLFTFLETRGEGTVNDFEASINRLYSLADVHDYIVYNFYSYLQEVHEDSANWSAIKIAIERTEGLNADATTITDAIKIVKAVGLLNIFASSAASIDKQFLIVYASYAMDVCQVGSVIDLLEKNQILRFAKYKSKYILFEGTDVDLEAGLYEAARECKHPDVIAEKVCEYFDDKIALANAHYFRTGTPRYFQYCLTSSPIEYIVSGETDGIINVILTRQEDLVAVKAACTDINGKAILYCIFENTTEIADHLFEIDKLHWVRDYYVADESDKVANREIANLLVHEKSMLNKTIMESLFSDNVTWIFNGEILASITSRKILAQQLSTICDSVYYATPIYRFELINKHRPTGNMSLARQSYLQALLDHSSEPYLGFERDKYPPEKSLYLTLLKNTGIHTTAGLGSPTEPSFQPLWDACENFLRSTIGKPHKLGELFTLLEAAPFRLKQGLLYCWIPTYLIIKRDDFALYNSDGTYVPYINKEVLDLILRSPNGFLIKAFAVDGVRRTFFDKYREAINMGSSELSTQSFIETIRPFLTFYKKLNSYARRTKDISPNARKFRDVIAKATDPEKTFFEVLPDELGFKEITLSQNPEAIESFVAVIQEAIRELRNCYSELVGNIEQYLLKILRLEEVGFSDYHHLIAERYKSVKTELMPVNMRNFQARLVGNYDDKTTWIEAVSYVALNKPLTEIRDTDKSFLLATLKDMLFQLDDYVEMHKTASEDVIRLHITQNKSKAVTTQVILSEAMRQEVNSLENKLESILSGDNSLDVAALIAILKKKLK